MTFLTALVLGLLASTHCAAMCGGLQQALQPARLIRTSSELHWHNLLMNTGRLTTYVFAGAGLAWSSYALLDLLNLQKYVVNLRFIMALILLLIGVQLLLRSTLGLPFLARIGRAGWSEIKHWYKPDNATRIRSFSNGMIWGALPCGLLYTVYFTAAVSGDPLQGGLIMLGFGIGTTPSLLLSGTLWLWLKRRIRHTNVQTLGGVFYLSGGLLMLAAPNFVTAEFAQNFPELVSTVFCLTNL